MADRIFLSPPHRAGTELAFLQQALESNYLAPVGPDLDAFEAEIGRLLALPALPTTGRRLVALNSGAAALHLALVLAGVGAGDVVLCPDFAFIASAAPVVQLGAQICAVDAEYATWNMDPDRAEAALVRLQREGRPAKALVVVHGYGRPARMDRFLDLARRFGLALIEDAAESLAATALGRHTGTLGDFGILSFNGNKLITTSGGGMLCCARPEDAEKALALATMARDPGPFFTHSFLGYSYRLSNLLAALGRAQLEALPQRLEQKRRVLEGYRERLAGVAGISFLPEPDPAWGTSNHWLTCIVFDDPGSARGHARREAVRLALERENIEARALWTPLHRQPALTELAGAGLVEGGDVADDLFARGLALPSGTTLTEADQDRICEILAAAASA
ncbi:DegT/DnrJ/EryC1/StrS family aminotransferase [Megalodesulfovibrio gigas]|uniref:Putative DegT/DnrJ/EryC1/StrS aminotransferase n=1 Tax=Megalodesulfovibrio gigas (strain ATCC 19364 / DSM 1382 / NCIMB 9332 / VKM B-1759) TaxID=1121448 RepID=T2GA07_MEGG1|nr:DegT/DnrJ/EryC1/StrS family aminotransferase [Megalodesulfovibrio gigas]AGW12961.1 putative DegT/DnrJ/EryC1/StrS aminotransferase [Megalodesulfovibrio gigas DSM 1382 = ATCC 19364]